MKVSDIRIEDVAEYMNIPLSDYNKLQERMRLYNSVNLVVSKELQSISRDLSIVEAKIALDRVNEEKYYTLLIELFAKWKRTEEVYNLLYALSYNIVKACDTINTTNIQKKSFWQKLKLLMGINSHDNV